MKRWTLPLLEAALSIAAFLALGEIGVRLVAPQNLSGTWFETGPRGLVLNRADWQARHQHGERVLTYRFNRLHQRGAEPAPGVPRVLVLGNSFTFGWLLEEADTVPGRLQTHADSDLGPGRVQFLNAATGGWELASYLAYLEAFGERVMPAAVAVFVTAGDFPRATASRLYELADAKSGTLVETEAPRPGAVREFLRRLPGGEWLLTHSHLVQLVRQRLVGLGQGPEAAAGPGAVGWGSFSYFPSAEDQAMGRALLKRMKAWCEARDIPLLVLTHYHFNHPNDIYRWLGPATAEIGVPFLDLQPEMAAAVGANEAAYFMGEDPHPNERNNALFAERAWRWMKPVIESVAGRRP